MEEWKNGRKEEWKDGMVEDWKNVAIRPPIAIGATMEEWKNGRMGNLPRRHGEHGDGRKCRLPTALCFKATADCRLATGNCPLSHCPTANWQLATAYFFLMPFLYSSLCARRSALCKIKIL